MKENISTLPISSLGDSASYLVAIVESSDDAIISKNLDGIITSWNAAAVRIFGYTAKEAVGRPITLIVPHDRLDEERGIMTRLRNGERVNHIETVRVAKDGHSVDLSISISPIYDTEGKMVGASKVARDITERKAMIKQLRESEARAAKARDWLHTTLTSIGDGVIAVDEKGRVTFQNSVSQSLTGWSQEEAVGVPLEQVFIINNEKTGQTVENPVAKALEGNIVTLANHTILTSKDGRKIPIEDSAAPIRDGQGNISGVVLVFRDVTERKAMIAELRYAKEEMEDFTHIASHDLKEPLRGLILQATFLKEDYADDLGKEGLEQIDRLVELGRRSYALINEILQFSRLGKRELSWQEVDPNEILKDVEQMMAVRLRERRARIDVPRTLPFFKGDKIVFTEVLRNLITNGVTYNDKDEPVVEVGFKDEMQTAEGPEEHVFYVRDNGIGIHPESQKKIFLLFKRLRTSEKYNHTGTGVGLTFVKKMIERCNGRIWLESEPDRGSTFYFTVGECASFSDDRISEVKKCQAASCIDVKADHLP